MATAAKEKRTAKAGEGAAKLDAAEMRKIRGHAAAVHAYGGDGDEFDMAATAYNDATAAITAFTNIARDAEPRDILDIVDKGRLFPGSDSRMAHGRPGLAWFTIIDFLTGWVLIQGGYFSRGQKLRLDLSIAEFDQAWSGMFDALLDRFPDSAAVLVPIQSGFDELFSACMLNDWHKKDADNKANEEQCSIKAIELVARLADALKIAARLEIAAGGHSVKGAAELARTEAATVAQGANIGEGVPAAGSDAASVDERQGVATGPRFPRGNEAKILQRVYILHNARNGKGMNWSVARGVLDRTTLADLDGVPVRMFDDSGVALGYAPQSDDAFRQWVRRAADDEDVSQMAREFAERGRAPVL